MPGSNQIVFNKHVLMGKQQFSISREATTTTRPSKPLRQSNEKVGRTTEERHQKRMVGLGKKN